VTFATFGFGVVGFFRSLVQMTHSEQAVHLHQAAIHFGVALIVIGLISTILAAFSHWIILRRLRRGEELSVTQWPLTITIAVFISVLGLCALWFIFNP
jgi:putative membrane protein